MEWTTVKSKTPAVITVTFIKVNSPFGLLLPYLKNEGDLTMWSSKSFPPPTLDKTISRKTDINQKLQTWFFTCNGFTDAYQCQQKWNPSPFFFPDSDLAGIPVSNKIVLRSWDSQKDRTTSKTTILWL